MAAPPSHALSLLALGFGSLPLVAAAIVVEFAVLARGAYTRESTHVVLAAVAVPCLLVSTWAVLEALQPSGGVYWGGVASAAVGGLLVVLVLVDAVVGIVVRARDSEDVL